MTRDFALERDRMVEEQLARRGISGARVLDAMREVPRERFVSAAFAEHAYDDSPLPIEAGQTISQPYIVAAMMVAAEVAPGDRVLEVGAGSGYAAAVASRIAGRVYGVERHEELGRLAAERMTALGYDNVEIRIGDGSVGLVDKAPFDAILVAAAGRAVPYALKEQLEIGGRLVMPVGGEDNQKLCKVTRVGANHYEEDHLGAVAFVPLISEPA